MSGIGGRIIFCILGLIQNGGFLSMEFTQQFHPVGQGLFYSSRLELDNNQTVNIVFDCGSDNKANVDRCIRRCKKETIDILVLSHLHYDHISGLEELLKKCKVKKVILPYLSIEERLLVSVSEQISEEWYNVFLINPYTYLSEYAEEVIVIYGNGDGDNTSDYSIPQLDTENIPDIENEDSNIEPNIKPKIELEKIVESEKEDIVSGDSSLLENKKICLVKDKGYILVSNLFLCFYNHRMGKSKLKAFKKKIKPLLRSGFTSILDELNNEKRLKKWKEAYGELRKDLNITSLAMYQGYIIPNRKSSRLRLDFESTALLRSFPFINNTCDCDDCHGYFDGHFHGRHRTTNRNTIHLDYVCYTSSRCKCNFILGTLFLGDIKLDYKTEKKDELFIHFKNYLQSVNLAQLSHHGASNGWNDNMIDNIPSTAVYVATHGLENSYKHPNKKVIMEIAKNNRMFVSVNEDNRYFSRLIVR